MHHPRLWSATHVGYYTSSSAPGDYQRVYVGGRGTIRCALRNCFRLGAGVLLLRRDLRKSASKRVVKRIYQYSWRSTGANDAGVHVVHREPNTDPCVGIRHSQRAAATCVAESTRIGT